MADSKENKKLLIVNEILGVKELIYHNCDNEV